MKSAVNCKHQAPRNIAISGYLVTIPSLPTHEKEGLITVTLVVALEPSDIRKPFTKGSLALVNVRGLLAELCRDELRFGDQIQIEGVLRARTFPTASGVHRIVHEIEASMIIPVHPEDLS